VDGVVPHPSAGSVCSFASERCLDSKSALATSLNPSVCGFQQNRDIAGEQLGSLLRDCEQTIVDNGDLFGFIPNEGDVKAGVRSNLFEDAEHNRKAALHVRGPQTEQGLTFKTRLFVAVRGDRV